MNLTSISFLDLPFTPLFRDYVTRFDKTRTFFETDPFSEEEFHARLDDFSCAGDRSRIVDYLKAYNQRFDADDTVLKTIDRFNDQNAVAVVTGQQLILYGGPLFTVYKILTAISYARRWEQKYNRPFIPVFWMADEDHDYEEASRLSVPDREEVHHLYLEPESNHSLRVSDIAFGKNLDEFRKALRKSQPDTEFTEKLWEDLDAIYHPETTAGQAFGRWILHLFGKYGVVLAGTNSVHAKRQIAGPMQKSVEHADEHLQALRRKSEQLLDAGYHNQVQLQRSNLFWIDEHHNRLKISSENGEWTADGSGKSWTARELIEDIGENSERFSPNVFLRPVVQNYLLPAVAYVAGPGETAYYAQMKDFYRQFGLSMPVILPRFGATVLESGIGRIFDKLPFSLPDYHQRIEDLESQYIDQTDSPDIEAIFGNWKQAVGDVSEEHIRKIREIDPTLKGSSEKAKTLFFNELDKLKGKTYRSVKEQEKTQLQRIKKIKTNLFPDGNLQEREVAFIYFMNKYGPDIWDNFLEAFEDEVPDSHKLIRL